MDSPKPKRQHVDRTLKEKLEILKHVGSMKGIDICRKYGIKQSTLSDMEEEEIRITRDGRRRQSTGPKVQPWILPTPS